MQSTTIKAGTLSAARVLAEQIGVKTLEVLAMAEEISKGQPIGPEHIAQIRRFCGA